MIRLAKASDCEELLRIYAPFVQSTVISFETEVPSNAEFAARIEAISKKYPYLVCQDGGRIAGYAYASRHREREAYRYDVDVSVYVLPEYHGSGAAHGLYDCLFEILRELGYRNAYAAYTEPNEKSRRFHEKFGFTLIGTHHKTGYKFGRWHDVTWLEKSLGEADGQPGVIKSINEFPDGLLSDILRSVR